MAPHKPGIFVRLSNLIVLQVIFIFAALALILFNPTDSQQVDHKNSGVLQTVFRAAQIVSLMETDDSQSSVSIPEQRVQLITSLASEPQVSCVWLIRSGDSARLEPELIYSRARNGSVSSEAAAVLQEDSQILRLVGQEESGFLTMRSSGSDRMRYFVKASDAGDRAPSILVVDMENRISEAANSQLQYVIFLLFLFSVLISLLTVYLFSKRFRQPFDRLIRGLEKTAEGELYYLVPADADKEFNRLASAFNSMTRRLWEGRKQLNRYNAKLKKSNQSMMETQMFLAMLIDKSPSAILVTESNGSIMIFNQAASDVFGCSAEDVTGSSVSSMFDRLPSLREGCEESSAKGQEVVCRRTDGETFPAYVIVCPIAVHQDQPSGTLLFVKDISESKNFQEMMIRLDRYYSRGEMAGEIAHEINNYLAVLMGNLELLPIVLRKGDQDKADKKLDLMKTTVDRIARFANGLMDRPQEDTRLETISLNQTVENIIAFLKPQNKFNAINIAVDLSVDLPLIQLDQGQMQQLIVNLVYNAGDAIKSIEGEKIIRVTTRAIEIDSVRYAEIEIRDNGAGVPPDKAESLFETRFTTKRKGHGIGLITCRKIVANHGGDITYRTDGGAVFTFRIPVEPSHIPETSSEVESSVAPA
ncbi:MAG: hypothetical protein DRP45_00040 [Candidatus Zixiibacteriota bacterium]|nr:MAG: hypothetical protein DRP45_00040 [candidate division Zixibacteria bacterium]